MASCSAGDTKNYKSNKNKQISALAHPSQRRKQKLNPQRQPGRQLAEDRRVVLAQLISLQSSHILNLVRNFSRKITSCVAGPALEKKSISQHPHITSQYTILRRNLIGTEILRKPKIKGE